MLFVLGREQLCIIRSRESREDRVTGVNKGDDDLITFSVSM